MSRGTETQEPKYPQLAAKVQAALARREALKAKGSANVVPTSYFAPTVDQAEALLVALIADPDWSNETKQEESSADTYFVFRKRNLAAGEQPTIIRVGYNELADDLVMTITGMAMPQGFVIADVKPQEVIAAEKASAKRKAEAKAANRRAEFLARLGF